VTETCASGSPPAQTGGTVADGTYVVTSVSNYACDDSGSGTQGAVQVTLVIAGGCGQIAIAGPYAGGTKIVGSSGQLVFSGTSLSVTQVCPSANPTNTVSYTATSTGFTTFSSADVLEVYTKQ